MVSRAIDIAVPVYNGYEDLLLCLESLEKHTDLSVHRVILIDDCSTDARVREVLTQWCGESVTPGSAEAKARESGMIAVFNERNQGFSANVNIGLAWSDRDTILLNSDTIVTGGWVEKLTACAYRSRRIATVTPLSNAATLASVPVFLKDNKIPEGWTVDSFADLTQRVSLHRYPRITVGVGFCLYVKQEAYALAGAFDQKTFGRGYGEENDFCCRCSMLGFTHVLCDDTFIYHRGTGSFETEEKKALLEEHEKILRKRYPDLMKANDEYCRDNPDQEIRDNLLLHMCLENGKKNLLYVLHLDFRQMARSSIGGTQLHVRDLVRGAKKDWNVFVASRDGNSLRLTVYLDEGQALPEWRLLQTEETVDDSVRLVSMKFPIGEEEAFPVIRDEALEELFRKILVSFSIDLVHVHHTSGLSLDIFHVCRQLQIPVAASLHDYYYACPTVKLIREDGSFCPQAGSFAPANEQVCARCLHKTCGFGRVHYIDRWRRENREALLCCDRIIFPSESAKSLMLRAFPELEERSCVIGHGTDPEAGGGQVRSLTAKIIRSEKMHTRLDQQPGSGSAFHYIAGWAYLEEEDSRDTTILAEIKDSAGKVHFMEVSKNARADVAASAQSSLYLWSGFHAVFNVPDMPDGKYRIRLLIEAGGKVFTDGQVYTGDYRRFGSSRKKSAPDASQRGRMNVAFLGGVTPAKGAELLAQIVADPDPAFNYYVYGEVGDPRVRAQKGADNVFFSGVYRREDIYDLLKLSRIDVVCILPVWAETFCYTLSEAWACGIPVIGTNIGAVRDRIEETGAGWVLPEGVGKQELTAFLHHLADHPEEIAQKKQALLEHPLRSVDAMNEAYRVLYREMSGAKKTQDLQEEDRSKAADAGMDGSEFLFQGLASGNPSVTGRSGAAALNRLREENEMLVSSMEILKNTTSYRFARAISEANVPLKEPLKKLLRKR